MHRTHHICRCKHDSSARWVIRSNLGAFFHDHEGFTVWADCKSFVIMEN